MVPQSDINQFKSKISSISVSGDTETVKPVSGNVTVNVDQVSEPFINTLEKYFTAPFLTLIQLYISRMNESKNEEDEIYTLRIFIIRHRNVLVGAFTFDLIARIVILFIVLVVVLRGLGLIDF